IRVRSSSKTVSPDARRRATISLIRTVFQTSTALDSRLRQLALFRAEPGGAGVGAEPGSGRSRGRALLLGWSGGRAWGGAVVGAGRGSGGSGGGVLLFVFRRSRRTGPRPGSPGLAPRPPGPASLLGRSRGQAWLLAEPGSSLVICFWRSRGQAWLFVFRRSRR